jgi:hypothetical protein
VDLEALGERRRQREQAAAEEAAEATMEATET